MLRLLTAILAFSIPSFALADKRVALVIGNNAYSEVAPLQKAVADAESVAAKMEAAGYQTILETDAGRRDTNLAISRFTELLEPGDTAFIFYAGHGVQIDGENYLLPTDIAAPSGVSEGFVTSESIPLSNLLERVRRTGARTTLAILDACRDNPFAATTGRSVGGTRGLARIAAPEGTFVMFSAGAGQQALDRLSDTDANRNSVFTRALLPKLEQEGLELRDMIFELREEVRDLARTQNHQQFPAYYDELSGDFFILPATAKRDGSSQIDAPPTQPSVPSDSIRSDFDLARSIGSPAAYERFIETYKDHPDQFVVSVARDLLAGLAPEVAIKDDKPSPEPEPSEADTRAIMRATQEELNRLGCGAGGADGVAGRKTRTAFAAFLGVSETPLVAAELGSQKALAALRDQTRKCPVPKTPTPVATLSGTWSFASQCPNGIKTTGTARYQQTGPGQFSGTWSDSLGISGTLTVRLNGRDFSSSVSWGWGTATENGRLSTSGRSYSSRTSTGCQIRANRVN